MAIIDSKGKQYQEPTTPNFNELASSDYGLYEKGDILPYNPDTIVGRRGFNMYDPQRIDDQVTAYLHPPRFAT